MHADLETEIANARRQLDRVIVHTPVLPLQSDRWGDHLPDIAGGAVKLELFQQTGSFKARGAYLGVAALSEVQRQRGIVAASGGNHALAVTWASAKAGVSSKIAIPKNADPLRIEGCRKMGAEVVLCEDIKHSFEVMQQSVTEEARTMMHPFEAQNMILGAATCGAEFMYQAPDLQMIVVPVGGGGLISGIAAAVKLLKPEVEVIGVEPTGADTMTRSLQQGEPVKIDQVQTIADSLASPTALPKTFELTRRYVDRMVRVEDEALCNAMKIYRKVLGLSVEPACAASLAALVGPLREHAYDRHVGLVACGSNIGPDRYRSLVG